jgi:hypothetical protein
MGKQIKHTRQVTKTGTIYEAGGEKINTDLFDEMMEETLHSDIIEEINEVEKKLGFACSKLVQQNILAVSLEDSKSLLMLYEVALNDNVKRIILDNPALENDELYRMGRIEINKELREDIRTEYRVRMSWKNPNKVQIFGEVKEEVVNQFFDDIASGKVKKFEPSKK